MSQQQLAGGAHLDGATRVTFGQCRASQCKVAEDNLLQRLRFTDTMFSSKERESDRKAIIRPSVIQDFSLSRASRLVAFGNALRSFAATLQQREDASIWILVTPPFIAAREKLQVARSCFFESPSSRLNILSVKMQVGKSSRLAAAPSWGNECAESEVRVLANIASCGAKKCLHTVV